MSKLIFALRSSLIVACFLFLCACTERNFKTQSACNSYVEKNSSNDEKLIVGRNSCAWSFVELDRIAPLRSNETTSSNKEQEGRINNDQQAISYEPLFSKKELQDQAIAERKIAAAKKKLATCIIKKFDQIQDDQSGTKIVADCGKSVNEVSLARIVARQFSPSFRMEKFLEKQQMERDRIANENREDQLRRSQGFPDIDLSGALPTMIEINGQLKTCLRIGPTLDCD